MGSQESQAVSRFGNDVSTMNTKRLSSILGQSRQTGMKNLQELLAPGDGYCLGTSRKQAAKRLGEEAGTEAAPAIISDASGGHGIGDGSGADGDACKATEGCCEWKAVVNGKRNSHKIRKGFIYEIKTGNKSIFDG